jgi:hypothetical protein
MPPWGFTRVVRSGEGWGLPGGHHRGLSHGHSQGPRGAFRLAELDISAAIDIRTMVLTRGDYSIIVGWGSLGTRHR